MTSIAYGALWIFVFAIPWERVIVLPGVSIVTRVTGGIAFGLAVFAIIVTGRVRLWRWFHIAGFLFVAWVGFGVWYIGMRQIPQKFYTFVLLFIVLGLVWELAPSVSRLRGLMLAYIGGAYVAALDTLWIYHREGSALKRFSAGGADPNSLAMTLSLSIPMAWYLSLTTDRRWVKWCCRCYLPVGLLGIALTGSRGGMITCMVALLIVPLTMTLSPGRLATAIVVLGLSGALAVVYVPEKIVERLATTGQEVQDARLGGRFKLWVAGMHAFVRKPIVGYGVGDFKGAIYGEMGSATQVAHNSFISVLVEEGLVGLLLYLAMLFSVFLAIQRLPRLERRFAWVLFTTLGLAMSPLTWEDQKDVWFIMALLTGLSHVAARSFRRAPATAPPLRTPVPAAVFAGGRLAGPARGAGRAPGWSAGPDPEA